MHSAKSDALRTAICVPIVHSTTSAHSTAITGGSGLAYDHWRWATAHGFQPANSQATFGGWLL
jgi:hypothetical protein